MEAQPGEQLGQFLAFSAEITVIPAAEVEEATRKDPTL